MSKVSITTLEHAQQMPAPTAAKGRINSRAYFSKPSDPIHLSWHEMASGAELDVVGEPNDRLIYVWKGSLDAGGMTLRAGSSAIVEFGSGLALRANADSTTLLIFNVKERRALDRGGGNVHLLPSDMVARTTSFGGNAGIGGGMHADARCPTCKVWLHEQGYAAADKETAPHSHSEDEIIFVTAGAIRLGNRIYGPGTALAIAANVKYGFHSGPDGLQFINFRGSSPTYTSADGSMVLDEAELWRSALGAPVYQAPRIS
jgi:hypothetical protein